MKQTILPSIKIAGFEIQSIYDGEVTVNPEEIFTHSNKDITKDEAYKNLMSSPAVISVNVFLLVKDDLKILIDTGAGENFGSQYNSRLVDMLKKQCISTNDITDIYLTHIHNDHTGGLIAEQKRVFKNATIHVHKRELEFWMDENNLQSAKTDVLSPNKKSFLNARKALVPYLENQQVTVFDITTELPEGFSVIEMFGHTPGHCLFQVKDQNQALIFCADIVHIADLQFRFLEIIDGFDIDKNVGLQNRLNFYSEAADKSYLLAGAYLPYPGIGKIKRTAGVYCWTAEME